MGQGGIGIGVAGGTGAVGGAISGLLAGSAAGPYGWVIGAIVGGVLGAASAAAGLLLQQKPKNPAQNDDIVQTLSDRLKPIPVIFGNARAGGIWIAVGNFLVVKDNLKQVKNRYLRVCNAVLAISEGSVQAMGNVRQDGQTLKALWLAENLSGGNYQYYAQRGTNAQQFGVANFPHPLTDFSDPHKGMPTPFIPWRNTALLYVHTVVGTTSRMPAVNIDNAGPDFTIRRNGTTAESNSGDFLLYALYDGHTESFYYTLNDSFATAAPYGMCGIGREGGLRTHTPPPTGVSSVTKAWYLGRHDVLAMQDPGDSGLFHLGRWGLAPSSTEWEHQRPIPDGGGTGYEHPILCFHFDERHGILHSVHDDGTVRYVLRWNLLTDRIERMATGLPASTFRAMLYAAELNCYVFAADSARLHFVDPDDGTVFQTSLAVVTSNTLGLCMSGQLVGVVWDGGFEYYNPHDGTTTTNYGTGTNSTNIGCLGGIHSACQNTFTGHVTISRSGPSLINFIPSVIEDKQDITANGTSGLGNLPDAAAVGGHPNSGKFVPEPDFQDFSTPGSPFWPGDATFGWVRDWSYRTYNTWNLVSLQGHSGLAAAAWAAFVDEPNLDSRRWGGGLDKKYFSLGSFEGLHAWCVGGVVATNNDGTTRLAEKSKFDYMLDTQKSAASFVADDILLCCQGYRTMVGGVLHVGVQKPGMWPVWHFSDAQIADENGKSSFAVKFLGRSDGPNRVRVGYRNILNEYSHDFAQADDEWDQNARSIVQLATIVAEGCGRFHSADILAKSVLDQVLGARRQATFKTHFVAWLLNPGDSIEVSSTQCALNRVPMDLMSLAEGQANDPIELIALEHRGALDALLGRASVTLPPGAGTIQTVPDNCDTQEVSLDGFETWFNEGAAYAAGTYALTYTGGTYRPNATYENAVAGWDVMTLDPSGDGVRVVLGATPGTSVSSPGWHTPDEAAAANVGQYILVTLTATGPIGLRRTGGGTTFSSTGAAPTFQLCIWAGTGSGSGGAGVTAGTVPQTDGNPNFPPTRYPPYYPPYQPPPFTTPTYPNQPNITLMPPTVTVTGPRIIVGNTPQGTPQNNFGSGSGPDCSGAGVSLSQIGSGGVPELGYDAPGVNCLAGGTTSGIQLIWNGVNWQITIYGPATQDANGADASTSWVGIYAGPDPRGDYTAVVATDDPSIVHVT
jgi:hypothetical protein